MRKFLLLTIALLLSLSNILAQTVVTVPAANTNSGSTNDPLGTYYGYERSAMIYTSAQIGSTGQINSIGFYLNAVTTPGQATDVRIYMKMRTTLMTLNTTYATETTGATLVYGPTTIPAASFTAGSWVTIPLTTPFNYTGGANHLEVIVETNATGAGNEGAAGKQFRRSTGGSVQYFQTWQLDTSPPTGAGVRSVNRPNIQLTFGAPAPMAFSSCTTTQNTANVAPNNTNQQIIGVQVVTTGSTSPISVTNLDLNITGSTAAADITNAKVYYTGTSATFATTTQFGSTVVGPTGAYSVTGTQALSSGTNYFWIAYDVPSTATLGNLLDATCSSITVAGTPRTPTVTAPAGNRPIALTYCNFSYTGGYSACGCIYIFGILVGCNDYGLTDIKFNSIDLYDNATCTDVAYIDRYSSTPAVTVTSGQTGVPISVSRYGNTYDTYMYVYVDWNNDGDFVDGDELIFSPFMIIPTTATGSVNIPATATAGAHRMRVVSAFGSPAPCSADQATAYDFKINVIAATPMAYANNTVNQITGNVAPGTADQPVLNIKVNTTGSVSPLNLNSITANTTGTTNPSTDITEARLFYTGAATTFNYGNIVSQVGTAIVNPNGTLTFTGNTQLLSGENNFWLVFSVAAGATNANLIDAQVTDIVVDNTSRTPSPSSPTGNLVIAVPPPFCTSGLYTTGCNDGVGALDGFTNVGINGVNNPSTCGTGGYTDFTGNTPYTLYKGQSNLFTVTNPDAATDVYSMAMYIDQNGNGAFEDSELYLYLSPASAWTGGTLVGNFTLPNILQPGLRRMRIRCAYNTPVVSGYQCNVYGLGEIEDYMVNILENPGVAQVGCGYAATNSPQAYSSFSDGTLLDSGSGIDDSNYPNQPIGFNFDYNGTIYTSLGVSSNGFVWFGSGTPSTTNFLPIGSASPNLNVTGTIDGIIAAFGSDIRGHAYPSVTPSIRVKTAGTAPNRTFTIQWTNFWHVDIDFLTGCFLSDDHRLDFQIILSENTGTIRMVYGNQDPYCIDVGYSAQVGLRGTNAADFNVRKLTSGQFPTAATTGTSFLDQFILASNRYFTGNTSYLFTPALVTPVITANGPTAFCDGGTVNLSTTTIATGYQWFESNLIETGQTANNYTVSDAGSYHIRVASGSCFRQSDPIAVTVYDLPDLVTTPVSVCAPTPVDLGTTFTDNNNTIGNIAYYPTLADANANTNAIAAPNNILLSGTYYIKKTTVAGSCTDVASVLVTINLSPKLTINNPTTVCAPATVDITAAGVTIDLNGLAGSLSYYPTEQDAIDGTNPLPTPAAISVSGTYWIKKTSTVGGCVDILPVTVTINPSCGPITWVGGTSGNETNWNTPNNWSTGAVPTATDDITIPDQPYDPELFTGANGAAKTVTIAAGATVTINTGYTLDVKGSWTGANNTVGGAGKLIFSGATAQSITGGIIANTLQIANSSGGVTIAAGAPKVRVNTALELKSGQLTTNANLITVSTALNTAYINDFSPTFGGTISGNVAVERYITNGPNGYRYIGAPVATTAGGSTLALSALSGFVISGTPGQLIPLPTCSPTNSAPNSPYGTFMRWEEAGPFTFNCRQAGWYFQTTGTMTIGRGYGAKVGSGTKITYTGAANTGAKSYGPLANSGTVGDGWHLVSNPYPSTIVFDDVPPNAISTDNMPTGFGGQIQLYQTSGPYTGSYLVLNSGVNPAYLSLGQGFWVRTATSGTFALTNNHRVTNAATYYNNNSERYHLNVNLGGNGYMDKTDVYFFSEAQTGFDFYDGEKWDSRADQPTIYTKIGNVQTGINSLPALEETIVVPMGVKPGTNGNFTFTFDDIATFPQTSMIYLEDLQLGTMTDLRANNSYNFSMTTNDDANRFMLHFQPGLQAEVADQDCDNAGSIELTQPAPTVWSTYEVRGNDNNVYAQGTDFTGSVTLTNLPPQEYVVTVTHASGYSAQEYITVNGSSPVNATINASATNVMVDEMVSLTGTATDATEYVWNFGDGNTQSGSSTVVHAYDAEGVYTVSMTASNSTCNDVASKVINVTKTTTGINSTVADNLIIYGQGERVVIEFNNWGGNKADIFMYNALGQRVESLTGVSTLKGRQDLYIANIVPGTYFIQVVSDGKIQGKKVFLGKH